MNGWYALHTKKLSLMCVLVLILSTFSPTLLFASSEPSTPTEQLLAASASFTSITGGRGHTAALKSDGTVWTWGLNNFGQLGDGTNTDRRLPVQVSGLSGVTAIASGAEYMAALKNDGTVWAWGNNDSGQLGDVTTTSRTRPVQVSGLSGVIAIAAGDSFTVALKSDGTVWTWGLNSYGQLGDGTRTDQFNQEDKSTPVQVSGLTGVTAIAAGSAHTIALKDDETVWTWGYNEFGQLGDGNTTYKTIPAKVASLSGVTSIAGGGLHTVVRRADGSVWIWGAGGSGQLGNGTTLNSLNPVQVPGISNVASIASGLLHTIALKTDGTVWAWGANGTGQLGDGTTTSRTSPVQVSGFSGVLAIAVGSYHTIALKSDGTVWTWGDNEFAQLGDGTWTDRSSPVQVQGLADATPDSPTITSISGGGFHSIALANDGTVWAAGANSYGQLGDGTTTNRSVFTQVPGIRAVSVAGGGNHTIALKSDGTVWAWGNNELGQLGDGTSTNRSTPVQVSGLSGVTAIASHWNHTIALKGDGTLWAWGTNENGQLGDGTMTTRSTPVQVNGLSGVIAISAGLSYSIAVKNDGTVWAWGLNAAGQLGDGSITNRLSPVQVSGLTGITAISSGEGHSIARKNDGTVWTWGANGYGQLGDGSTTNRTAPFQVSGLSGINAVAAGGLHSIALKNDGTVWTWGNNQLGQLGDGSTTDRRTPVQVAGLNGISAVAGGWVHTLALKNDGKVWSWGRNFEGQLGDGTTTHRSTPVQVQWSAAPTPGLTGITLDSVSYTLAKGNTHQTIVTAHYSDNATLTVTEQASYQSSDPAIASVNASGVVSGSNAGQTTITVTYLGQTVTASVTVTDSAGSRTAVLTTDRPAYNRGDDVTLSVRLRGFANTDKINSATFKLDYDTEAFELAAGNPETDIVDGSIPAHVKSEPTTGTLAYLVADPSKDYPVINDSVVFSVRFKVKPNAPLGTSIFTLKGTNADLSMNMLDSSFKVYQVPSVSSTVTITSGAKITAFVSLYLGDESSNLNSLLLGKVVEGEIDKAFENLTITVKSSSNDTGITYQGRSYWVPQANGHLAGVDSNNRVTGKLNISAITPLNNAIVEIGGFGYLVHRVTAVNLIADQANALGTSADKPIVLLPGDVGSIENGVFAIGSNGIIDNVDFSAWLKIFKDIQSGTASPSNKALMDFTRNGIVNNEDFSLWTAAYKKQ